MAIDAPVADHYTSGVGSDDSFNKPEYDDWNIEEEIKQIDFGLRSPEAGEMSNEDGCARESRLADPRRTQGCNTDQSERERHESVLVD